MDDFDTAYDQHFRKIYAQVVDLPQFEIDQIEEHFPLLACALETGHSCAYLSHSVRAHQAAILRVWCSAAAIVMDERERKRRSEVEKRDEEMARMLANSSF
jgi:hypothetical protein